ncbi:MAG: hypothetical protein AAGI24_04605 [Pseudomonadota bacterium]
MSLPKQPMLRMVSIGLPTLLALNLLGYAVLKQPAAVPFAKAWWSTWAPAYIALLAFFSAGVASLLQKNNDCE